MVGSIAKLPAGLLHRFFEHPHKKFKHTYTQTSRVAIAKAAFYITSTDVDVGTMTRLIEENTSKQKASIYPSAKRF